MACKSFATLLQTSGVAFLLFVLLFSGGSLHSSPGFIGSVLREIAAVLRDAETQWMVFLCLVIYFTAFVFLPSRAGNSLTQRRKGAKASWWQSAKTGAHRETRPSFWLTCALFIFAVLYAIDYSPSMPALTLLGGAVLGQGAGFLKSGMGKTESGNRFTTLVVVIFVVLLALASVWQTEMGHTFEYRNHARWSGRWDNPNIFGLLMGVGVALAIGGCISLFQFSKLGRSRGNEAHSSKVENGKRKAEIIETPHVVSYNFQKAWWFFATMCLVAAGFVTRGLLHSYSRGAWVATFCGLGYLIMRSEVRGQRSELEKTESKPGSLSAISKSRCVSRLAKSWLPFSVILISVLVLSFWHFRQTEWHPARRALSAVNQVDFSWRNRVAAWEGTLQMTGEKPWFGAGWNQPEPLYEHYYLSPKLTVSAAIEMNDYLMLGTTLGIPVLFCFGMYVGLSLTGKAESRKRKAEIENKPSEPALECGLWALDSLQAACRAGAIVLFIGFWFDGGLFKLPTAATFWILLELGQTDEQEVTEIAETPLKTMGASV